MNHINSCLEDFILESRFNFELLLSGVTVVGSERLHLVCSSRRSSLSSSFVRRYLVVSCAVLIFLPHGRQTRSDISLPLSKLIPISLHALESRKPLLSFLPDGLKRFSKNTLCSINFLYKYGTRCLRLVIYFSQLLLEYQT